MLRSSIFALNVFSQLPAQSLFFTRTFPSITHTRCLRKEISQRYGMSTTQPSNDSFLLGTLLKGDSGCTYKVEETLSDRKSPPLRVYRARSAEGKKYIIKNMIPGEFEYQLDLQKQLSSCPNVRAVVDTIQGLEMFIYPFLAGDLLRLSQKLPTKRDRVNVLRCALRGLADMHEKDILHNDIKPNNIMVNYDEDATGQMSINSVQISDLEDTVIVPPGKWLRGPLCGNAIWRSPESWCRARQNQASDIFSFGIVMIYVMVNEMVFRVSNSQLEAEDSWRYILRRHISYFADEDGLNGLLDHIGRDNPYYERLVTLADSIQPGDLRQPFESWEYVEPDLRELVGTMTNLDPTRRITAREALKHHWFSQADLREGSER